MASLADLLRYKKEVEIFDPRTGKTVSKVWLRVLGDLDLTKAYKAARLASASKREALRNPDSDDYKDEVLGVADLDNEEKKDLIKTSRLSSIIQDANVAVVRPELPQLNEVAVDPDAATLEELEKLDQLERSLEEDYQKKIDEYIALRLDELAATLETMSTEELTKETQTEISVLVPFSLFISELNAYKIFLGAYTDKDCKTKVFESVDDFKQLPRGVQDLLITSMNDLEINGSEIKN